MLLFQALGYAHVAAEGGGARVHHDLVVLAGERGHLLEGQAVGRRVDQAASGDERGGLGQPGGVPERADLAARLVARARAPIEPLEGRRMQEQRAPRHRPLRHARPRRPGRTARPRSQRRVRTRAQPAEREQTDACVDQLANAADDADREAARRVQAEGREQRDLASLLRPDLGRHEEENTIEEHSARLDRQRRAPALRAPDRAQDDVDLGRPDGPARDEACEDGGRAPPAEPRQRGVEVAPRPGPRDGTSRARRNRRSKPWVVVQNPRSTAQTNAIAGARAAAAASVATASATGCPSQPRVTATPGTDDHGDPQAG